MGDDMVEVQQEIHFLFLAIYARRRRIIDCIKRELEGSEGDY